MRFALSLALTAALLATSHLAHAFCGFYVAGADAELFNNATLVVMMRDGRRTVLSMQNNYQGPPEDFALVVPVPEVLQEENVKTLEDSIFDRVDKLAAPRLVEYWEVDPCFAEPDYEDRADSSPPLMMAPSESSRGSVKIEAQFKVGEYDIVVLSAGDSSSLDSWLRDHDYKIPDGAEPLLRPYVQGGMKFFVAKVDTSKVKFEDGQAMLSPLRFHYDDEKFRLPVRLGLANSPGTQDLIVHILAQDRYEVANYENVTIPTNIDLDEGAKARFGPFYAALFDATLAQNPRAVVTEYAWDAGTCDPCPSPGLSRSEITSLGGDVVQKANPFGMVLTRLHARYDAEGLGEDLVFRKAEPIAGGREARRDGKLETGSEPTKRNNFQGRYAIRHPWEGKIECDEPIRGRWGGPPGGGKPPATPALELAFQPRGAVKLASLVQHDVDEIGLEAKEGTVKHPGEVPAKNEEKAKSSPEKKSSDHAAPSSAAPESKGCGNCRLERHGSGQDALGLALLGTVLAWRRRRRQQGEPAQRSTEPRGSSTACSARRQNRLSIPPAARQP